MSSIMPRFTVTGPQDDASIMSTASATAHALPSKKPRRRRGRSFGGHVRIVIPENVKHQSAAERQLEQYQTRWNEIIEDLPPQLSRRHITMISIGGVIGTGVFLGIAQALFMGGPVGLLLGYSIVGSVVYAVVISVAEIVAWLPNVGGIVSLAGIYVDPALGFAMGWNAWYNWAVILPAEITAAVVLMRDFFVDPKWNPAVTAAVLMVAVGINCFGARLYGNVEFWFAMGKIITIVFLIIISIYLDTRQGPEGRIGFRYWKNPGPFGQYKDVTGPFSRFVGFWTVMIQASFSFFGAEVPGVAGGEVLNAPKNIPYAVRRIWIRILLFYILSVFMAGLLVPHDACELFPANEHYHCRPFLPGHKPSASLSSPFVIALRKAGQTTLSKIVNAGFVSSAWSAATSDMYISSRYMFFLARCKHAPKFCGRLFRRMPVDAAEDVRARAKTVPWVGVVIGGLVGCLAFLGSSTGNATAAVQAFNYLSAMTSIASLQSWLCMLITYLCWYRGSQKAMERPEFESTAEAEYIRDHRGLWQPYFAIYGLVMCFLILIFNGLGVFYNSTAWVIAYPSCDPPEHIPEPGGVSPVTKFISSYLPLPIFVMLYCSYKLIHRTEIVPYKRMPFRPGLNRQPRVDPWGDDEAEKHYSRPVPSGVSIWRKAQFLLGKFWHFMF